MSSLVRFRLLSCALSTFAVTAAFAGTQQFSLDPAHTVVRFRLRHLLGSVAGKFQEVTGTLKVDPENKERSSIVASLPSRTVNTGNQTRDGHLRSELFQTGEFPAIKFASTAVKPTGDNTADVTGDLTLHGMTRPFLLHVTLLNSEKHGGEIAVSHWKAVGALKRRDFGLIWSPGVETISMIGDEVAVEIEAEARAAH